MAVLNNRAARLVVGSKLIEGLRFGFSIKKTTAKEPNEATISVYNLSEQSRAALQSKGTKIILEAGYPDTLAQIFAGDSRVIDHVHDGPDWVTKIQCGDGERAYRYVRVAESFKPGTSVADAFRKVASATGLDVSDAVDYVRTRAPDQYVHGFSAHGRASAVIDQILSGRGLEWSIQDGKLYVLASDDAAPDSVVLLNADSGLIGSPEHGSPPQGEQPGKTPKKHQVLKVKSLLQPRFRAGGRVQLDALQLKGTFKIETLTHTGDTHGPDWYSELECVPLSN